MGRLATVVAMLGVAVASGALVLLGEASAMGSESTNIELLGAAILGFIIGIFLFGWGLGRRTGY